MNDTQKAEHIKKLKSVYPFFEWQVNGERFTAHIINRRLVTSAACPRGQIIETLSDILMTVEFDSGEYKLVI